MLRDILVMIKNINIDFIRTLFFFSLCGAKQVRCSPLFPKKVEVTKETERRDDRCVSEYLNSIADIWYLISFQNLCILKNIHTGHPDVRK